VEQINPDLFIALQRAGFMAGLLLSGMPLFIPPKRISKSKIFGGWRSSGGAFPLICCFRVPV